MKKIKKYDSREGGALVVVMMIIVVVSILGMGQLTNAKLAAIEAARGIQLDQYITLADMGLSEFRSITMAEKNRRTFSRLGFTISADTPAMTRPFISDSDGNAMGYYSIYITEATESDPEEAHYVIRSVAFDPDGSEKVQVESYMRLTTVSEDTMASQTEGNVWFADGDYIWGSIRSNSEFHFRGAPYIDGVTKTSENYYLYKTSSYSWEQTRTADDEVDTDMLNGGILYDQPDIEFDATLITDLETSAQQTLADGADITFLNDGTYTVTVKTVITEAQDAIYTYTKGRSSTRYTTTDYSTATGRGKTLVSTTAAVDEEATYSEPVSYSINNLGTSEDADNIIYVTGAATVRGVVNGTVSIAASEYIIVDESITYASTSTFDEDPHLWGDDEPDAEDRLGLYATEAVIAKRTDGNDINIHAAIYVSNESGPTIDDEDYNGFCIFEPTTDLNYPNINLYGSIVQNTRGVVARDGGGYKKNYNQDARFLTSPPPGNPLSSPEYFGWTSARLKSE
jgi:Tfp pilus assembly protein PilX